MGDITFERGRRYAAQDRVTHWHDGDELRAQVVGSGDAPYDLVVVFDDRTRSFSGHCSCPMVFNCKHVVAALVTLTLANERPKPRVVAEWERRLQPLVSRAATSQLPEEIAVMFDLKSSSGSTRLTIRPAVRNAKGKWVKAPVTWQTFAYPRAYSLNVDPLTHQLLREVLLLHRASTSTSYYGSAPAELRIDDIASSRLWSCLSDLHDHGVPFVDATRDHQPVRLFASATAATLDVSDDGESLVVRPLVVTPEPLPSGPSTFIFVGHPAHGIAVWTTRDDAAPAPLGLSVGPLAQPLGTEVQRLFDEAGEIVVPPGDRPRFVRVTWPMLTRSVPTSSLDGTFVPATTTVTLRLTCTNDAAHRVTLRWSWHYRTGEDVEEFALWPREGDAARDHAEERRLLSGLYGLSDSLREVTLEGPSRRFSPVQEVTGMAIVRFIEFDLPRLESLEGLDVVITEPLPHFVESPHTPRLSVTGTSSTDWFDLDISLDVGGETVPLRALFVALARDESHLLLPSGTYFSLDRPEFAQLRHLIDEAHESSPATSGTSGTLRVNRYQVSWWSDLENIATLSEEATRWSRAMHALRDVTDVAPVALPAGVQATLRHYQHVGFEWMSFLREHSLGGILADDMGLGKTLQTIAVIARAREVDPTGDPFLVVAPTSVVHNWAGELGRFSPELACVAVEATSARMDGPTLASRHQGAAVVITSYALFRLDFAAYQALGWSGLILDEAQYIKNHQSKGYACARQLAAPFKLALTGTPLENNLMELWALTSVVAPGLLPDARHFTAHYRTPIEKHADRARLEELRRRLRPFMLRRTKQEVVADLPEKIEQVIELDLNPRHRRLYDRQLQLERKKVLGLLDDVRKNRFKIFASLTLLRQLSIDPALVDAKHAKVPSTKLDALLEQIDEIVAGEHRVLVFSQFTRFLQKVRRRLDAQGVAYCYLDGSTRHRSTVIDQFKTGTAPVFLISLKAGGVGLNLTEADYCIVIDPWWNPATESQAVDRTHRIGQTKSVVVIRYVAKDTIEDKVMAMKRHKADLFASVLEGASATTASMTADDIRALLE